MIEGMMGEGQVMFVAIAVTAEPSGMATTKGLDFVAAIWPRWVMVPLRKLIAFHERGRMLKALAPAPDGA